MTEPGTRVWAVRNADQGTVWAFGFGTYAGDFPRPGDADEDRAMVERVIREADENPPPAWEAEWIAAERAKPIAQRVDELIYDLSLNPKIVLDGGGVVWGCECWWGEATDSTPAEWAKGRRIETVPAPHPADEETAKS